ncbi:L-threonylcarbamoyladenylate synthase [Venenivibrio stagnispumantis]|uniref:L-threonylcarbamoyladenylate synthase n=1 Tax=Venenivibrio stagnispumantis TaxID=407998 RepID=A0AA45WKS8_9AQUI|nr:L-threonylcarbamoyladenylate synthase [Venenivibrio stagnispumantis]MCW4573151.1 L-threonylcarbamoyladenylate synthase [Venenivibrio stagnispumantis]SMP08397.1 L-threonylcarbamoyladenylate synthase [Venenivibrio stagnispumantis]
MKISNILEDATDILKKGGIAVIKTDTLYGIIADATNKEAVERIYQIKKREKDKPFIILIPDISFIKQFGINISEKEKEILNEKGITVKIDLPKEKLKDLKYLHRGKNSLAFRIPDKEDLIEFLYKLEKPVVAPSANISGEEPATTIEEAIKSLGENIDIYIDQGKSNTLPSTIVKVKQNGKIEILRQGNKEIKLNENKRKL